MNSLYDPPPPPASDGTTTPGGGHGWADTLAGLLTNNRNHAILLGLAATVAILGWLARRATKSGHPDKILSILAVAIGMGWSAEAMWEVATQRLHVGVGFAVLAFTVFEFQLATAMTRAERHKKDRRRRDRHIKAAQNVALIAGIVVAFAADSLVEVVLRPVIPLLVVYQWKIGLTDEDDADAPEETSSWLWTPTKLLVLVGAKKPGNESVTEAQIRQQIDRMVKAADTIALGGGGWKTRRAKKRLRILARTATAEMVAEVARRQRRAAESEHLMVNSGAASHGVDAATQDDAGPVTQPGDAAADAVTQAAATHPDAPSGTVTRLDAARRDATTRPPRQPQRRTLTRTRTSTVDPASLADAVASVLAGHESCRAAAKARGLSDASVTRAVRDARQQGDAAGNGAVTRPDAPRDADASSAPSSPTARPVDAAAQPVTHNLTQPAAITVNGRMPNLTHAVTQ